MATPTFKYPDTTAPTTTIEFERADFIDDVPVLCGRQISDESYYGELRTYTIGANYVEIPCTFTVPVTSQEGNVADVSKIETFFGTTIEWGTNPFYYTDSAGTTRKVKAVFGTPKIDWKPSITHYTGRVLLREVD